MCLEDAPTHTKRGDGCSLHAILLHKVHVPMSFHCIEAHEATSFGVDAALWGQFGGVAKPDLGPIYLGFSLGPVSPWGQF